METETRRRRRYLRADTVIETPTGPIGPALSYDQELIFDDVVTRGKSPQPWQHFINVRSNATSFLSGFRRVIRSERGEITSRFNWNPSVFNPPLFIYPRTARKYGNLVLSAFTPSIGNPSAHADNLAKSRFIRDARAAQTEVQSLVSLGEIRETVRTLVGLVKGTRKLISGHLLGLEKDRKRFKKSTRKTKRKYLTDKYLEFTFGITPLVYDTINYAHALAKLSLDPQPSVRVEARGFDRTDVLVSGGTLSAGGSGRFTYDIRRRHTTEVKYYGVVTTSISPIGRFAETFGLGWKDFLPTVWELIPYSFVVDYFANISDIIDSATFDLSNFAWISKGIKETDEFYYCNFQKNFSAEINPGSIDEFFGGSPGALSDSCTGITRDRHSGTLIPSLELKLPKLFSRKALNVGALLSQHKRLTPF